MSTILKVPGQADWGNTGEDLDVESARKIFFGKSNAEVQPDFYRCVIERADELQHMPDIPFRYYVMGFRDFMNAGKFMIMDSADAASCFLNLMLFMLTNRSESIAPVRDELLPTIRFVGSNQQRFEASEDVYGSFANTLAQIETLFESIQFKD